MKSTAILLDGGFITKKIGALLGRFPRAQDIRDFANKCLQPTQEELFRIYYYDSPPYDGTSTHPISRQQINFATTATFAQNMQLQKDLCMSDYFSVRRGTTSFTGWIVKPVAVKEIIKQQRALQADDLKPNITQKGVDMEIGLDVAWLATKRLVQRVILVTGDSDFVPPMKFARREGIQVVLVTLYHQGIKDELIEHCDEHRVVTFP